MIGYILFGLNKNQLLLLLLYLDMFIFFKKIGITKLRWV
jgi:hypothetical protein